MPGRHRLAAWQFQFDESTWISHEFQQLKTIQAECNIVQMQQTLHFYDSFRDRHYQLCLSPRGKEYVIAFQMAMDKDHDFDALLKL